MTSTTSTMTSSVCGTCLTQFAPSEAPPERCPICDDDRQHVGWDGQRWTTHDELAATLHVRIEPDGDLLAVGIAERVGIPQRALLVPDEHAGNVLWDCIGVVTDEAVDRLTALGGVQAIAISHPHFYSAMVEWSDAFGGIPIHLHEADRDWVTRTSPHVRHWSGGRLALSPALTLIHLPGHFPGSSVLHWRSRSLGRDILLAGDSLHVAADRRHVSVMHSVPNFIPVGPDVIDDVRRRLTGVPVDDVYGFTWGLNVIGDGRAAIDASLDRYRRAISG